MDIGPVRSTSGRRFTLYGKDLPPHIGELVHVLMKSQCTTSLDGNVITIERKSDGFRLHLDRDNPTAVRPDVSRVKTPPPKPEGAEPLKDAPRPETYSFAAIERLFDGDISWAEYEAWGRDGTGDEPEPDATEAAIRVATDTRVDLRRVKGTGTGGRITKADVVAHLGSQ